MRKQFDSGQPFDENVARNTRRHLTGRPDQIAEGLHIGETHLTKPGVTQALLLAHAAEMACDLAERVEKMVGGRGGVIRALHDAGGLHLDLTHAAGYVPMSDHSFISFGYKSRTTDHAEAQGLWMAAQTLFNQELINLNQMTYQDFAYLGEDFSRPDALEAAAGIKVEAAAVMKKAAEMLAKAGLEEPSKLLDQAMRQMNRAAVDANVDIMPPKRYLTEEVERANSAVFYAVRDQMSYDLSGIDPEDLKAPKEFRNDIATVLLLLDGKRPDPDFPTVPMGPPGSRL